MSVTPSLPTIGVFIASSGCRTHRKFNCTDVKLLPYLAGLLLAAGAGSFLLLLNSCSTMDHTAAVPLHIEGATFVGNKACADCHANITRVFPGSPHARLHVESASMPGQNGCE